MFKVHAYLNAKVVIKGRMPHIPSVGDTMRFGDDKFGRVKEIIWCMDEPNDEGQRVNIRIEEEK